MQVLGKATLTADATVKEFEKGSVANFSVAINRVYKNDKKEKVEKTIFMDCRMSRKSFSEDFLNTVLAKGTTVNISGTLENAPNEKDGKTYENLHIRVNDIDLVKTPKKD
tara:strand:- start:560 stop:889 length:330 start_codon:yes stop_codon:yes gene_type:complete